MQLRDIVVLLDEWPASEARMHLATRMARNHGAHLSAAFVHHDQAVFEAPGIAVGHGLVAQLVRSRIFVTHFSGTLSYC